MHRFLGSAISGVFILLIAALLFTPTTAGQQATTKEQEVTIDMALEKVAQIRIHLETKDIVSAKRLLSELKTDLIKIRDGGVTLTVPGTVNRNTADIEAKVDKRVLQTKQLWLGVTPFHMSDLVWVQKGRLLVGKNKRFIYLGGDEPTDEKFRVVLLAFPADAKLREGKMRWTECKELGGTVLVSKTIHRVR